LHHAPGNAHVHAFAKL